MTEQDVEKLAKALASLISIVCIWGSVWYIFGGEYAALGLGLNTAFNIANSKKV